MNAKQKRGKCKCGCSEEEAALYARGYRYNCYWKITNANAKLKREQGGEPTKADSPRRENQKPIANRSKKGQKVANEDSKFFKAIWNDRPHYSEISNQFLGDMFSPVFMSHILTKAAYPELRHNKLNIMLMTYEEHQLWEFSDRSTPEFKRKFAKALLRYDILKNK